MHTTHPTAESDGIGGRLIPAAHRLQADDCLKAELAAQLRRTTFLLNSARLVIADEVARRIAADAVGEARATLAKVAP